MARHTNEPLLKKIRREPCLICGTTPCDAHHLRIDFETKGMGLRPGDDHAVPLCRTHHEDLHRHGNERLYWAMQGVDPMRYLEERGDG